MKIRKVLFLALALGVSALVAACGTSSGTATTDKAAQETKTTAVAETQVNVPEERPAYMGKVKEIIGNEVTLYKAAIPENLPATGGTPPERPAQGTNAQGDQAQSQTQSQSTDKAQASTEQRQGNRGFQMNFSETAETIMIPVGTPIVSMQRGGTGATEIALTGIKADKILRIWEKDGTITFVQVMSAGGGQRNNQQNANGNRQNTNGGGGQGMGGPPPGM